MTIFKFGPNSQFQNPHLSLNSSDSNTNSDSEIPLVVLPAAGFGTRVGSPQAKEVQIGPEGKPLIERALQQAAIRGWPVHVITRKEKTQLIDYLKQYSVRENLDVTVQIIEPSQEWPDTVLKSAPYWRKTNLLCLPDTSFEPQRIWDELIKALNTDPEMDLSVASFKPKDFSTWGVFRKESDQVQICEKPREVKSETVAWGLIGFRAKKGEKLFQAQLASTFDHQWKDLSLRGQFFPLEDFKDLTRG